MAKRYTDTDKYKKPFIRNLPGAYKLLWDYLYHSCDHAGIWIVDFEIAQIYLGHDMLVNKEDALKYFNEHETRIIEINNGSKWFMPSFIDFQYGELNESNKVHNSILQIFKKHNINYKGLARGLQSPMDKEKEMDKEMDKEIVALTEKFYNDLVQLVNPTRYKTNKPNLNKWADPIRLLHTQNKVPYGEMESVWKWAMNDSFWKAQILSTANFREHYDKLKIKMQNSKPKEDEPKAPPSINLTKLRKEREALMNQGK